MSRSGWVPVVPALGATVVLFGGAVVGAVVTSLHPAPDGGATLDAWRFVLADARFHRSLWFTVTLAVVTTLSAAALALLAARVIRGHRWAQVLFGLPVLLPHLLVAALAVLWLGPGGLADRALAPLPVELVRASSGAGIVLVYLFKEVPFLTLLLLAGWDDEVATLEESAAVAGAGPLRRLALVVAPALRGPLVLGAVVVAAFVTGAFEVPLLVGPNSPPMLATYALEETRVGGLAGRSHAAVALLVTTAVAVVLTTVAARRATRDA
ncbi:MAG: hypothetical protein KY469_06675 [Actinobacteria bacterium]|nr:hypothetical protein [Actinomycetota bacterium]